MAKIEEGMNKGVKANGRVEGPTLQQRQHKYQSDLSFPG